MKFSIGIPAYKSKYFEECIRSIMDQSYTDFELIILNDASPENLDEIVNKFSDTRIRYYKNEYNVGAVNVVDNWNKCLSYAQGEYFLLMGDDDKLALNNLELMDQLIVKNPNLDVYHARTIMIDEDSNPIILCPSWPEYESALENIYHRVHGFRFQFVSDFFYNTKSLKEQGGFYKLPLAWGSDDITSYIAADKAGIAHINIPIFYYRKSRITISSTGNIKVKLLAVNKELEWLYSFISKDTSTDMVSLLIKKDLQNYLPKYYRKKVILHLVDNLSIFSLRSVFITLRMAINFNVGFSGFLYCLLLNIKDRKK